MQIDGSLLLVGCGKMGGALLEGWLSQGVKPEAVTIIEPFESSFLEQLRARGVTAISVVSDLVADYDPAVVVLAIKPQMMDGTIREYRTLSNPGTVFLSIAAGKTIDYFQAALGDDSAIVRAMPNTPAAVSRGMTVLCANASASAMQKKTCSQLLSTVGETAWVEDEGLLDAVTAVSGGGPAYVFLLIECLAQAAIDAGLPDDLAQRLARVTVAGSGELVYQASESPSQLRKNVTSPAGTTLEALNVLMAADGLQPLMTRAIAAATQRSRELGRQDPT
ncbi:pyrroline-5-carboxylate reductase [Pelagibius sp. Alg239-R121]|uniref:pyrroline-5-carboxylate reductase n=1 Tax=Pelagibius sp. Alg239-R121 TaxID=2993448 RepID=UPI0024A7559C|nr:pyrroline-5-carboxylate reductase [Pelagibius sp. Alg239-R121]